MSHAGVTAMTLASFIILAPGCAKTTTIHGVPNWREVDPGVYRSGQPATAAEWLWIKRQGVRHVLKLNDPSEGSDASARAVGLDVRHIGLPPKNAMEVFSQPSAVKLVEAERLLETATPGDAWLVHCTHGQDRTGLVVGRYRVLHDGWSKARARTEMLRDGFHPVLHGLDEAWENFQPSKGKP